MGNPGVSHEAVSRMREARLIVPAIERSTGPWRLSWWVWRVTETGSEMLAERQQAA